MVGDYNKIFVTDFIHSKVTNIITYLYIVVNITVAEAPHLIVE